MNVFLTVFPFVLLVLFLISCAAYVVLCFAQRQDLGPEIVLLNSEQKERFARSMRSEKKRLHLVQSQMSLVGAVFVILFSFMKTETGITSFFSDGLLLFAFLSLGALAVIHYAFYRQIEV